VYLIGLYPLIKGNWTQELQYWSPIPIAPGSIINTHLRTKLISGMVFKCLPVHEAKGEIKDAEFKTRKIESPHPIHIVRPEYIQAILKASTYFVQNTGAMLKGAIPACAFTQLSEDNSTPASVIESPASDDNKQKTDIVAISTQHEDRISTYKSIIREELARKTSVILISPTVHTAEALYETIKKGIEHMTALIHGSLSKKNMEQIWNTTITSPKPVVIITTPQFVSLPRTDIGTIIVEHESSRAYRTFHSPFFDWKKIIENYAKELRIKLVYGDQLLSFETIHRIQTHEIFEIFPLSYRVQYDTELLVVDMIESKRKAGAYVLLSEELTSMIEYSHKKGQQMFIFSARRGLSPQTICNDCNTTVICSLCQAPVVLHTSPATKERFFLCHHCGKDRTALEACRNCNSWNLNTLGIGSDTIYEALQAQYPHIPLFKIDADAFKTVTKFLLICNS
jgi:primosomal protein N'